MRLVSAIRGLILPVSLGKGLQLGNGLTILNESDRIKKLVSPDLMRMMGLLEYGTLIGGPAFSSDVEVNAEVTGDRRSVHLLIANWMQMIRLFFQSLWLIRDNAVNCEIGYAQWNHPSEGSMCSSNFIAALYFRVDGGDAPEEFTLDELRWARNIYTEFLLPMAMDFGKLPVGRTEASTPFHKGSRRLVRFNYFLGAARGEGAPAVRISLYMTCLEILFSTDSSELTHKLSERVAMFVGESPQERRQIFEQMKRAYGIRSRIVHGATLSAKNEDELVSISQSIDQLIRRIYLRIIDSRAILEELEQSDLDDYFLRLLFQESHHGETK